MNIKYSFYKYHKWLLMAAGSWHLKLENTLLNSLYKMYAILLYNFSILMVQNVLVSVVIYRKCPLRVMELACYYVQYTNVLVMSYLSKTKKMKRVLNYISDGENKEFSEVDIATYEKYAKINRNTIYIIFSMTVLASAPWYTFVIKASLAEEADPVNCPLKRYMCYQLWYPFDLYHKQFWIAKLADTVLFWSMFVCLTFTRAITVFFMVYVLGQVKILQNRLRGIDETSKYLVDIKNMEYDRAVLESIIGCAKKYEEIQILMQLVNKACREFVLIGFFSNSMEIAMFLMQLLVATTFADALKQMVIVFMTLTQLFLLVWYANGIKEESGNLANVIYNETNWINYNTPSRKMLILIMTRSQKPLTCNSAVIGDMTINTFKAMIKLCYSITTFFKTAYL